MKSSKTKYVAGLLALGTLLTGSAYAEHTSHSALECSGSTRFDGWGLLFAAVSSSAGPNHVTKAYCPLTRPNATSSGNISSIRVNLWDRSSEGATLCRARSCEGDASGCSWSSSAGTGEAYEGKQTLDLGSVASYSGGYAYIECSFDVVPSGSHSDYKLYSYRSND